MVSKKIKQLGLWITADDSIITSDSISKNLYTTQLTQSDRSDVR